MFDDIIEFGGHVAASRYVTNFYPLCVAGTNDESSADVRQSAVYGIGVCAVAASSAFLPEVDNALKLLTAVINKKSSRNDDNGMATDNAISSYFKICRTQLLLPGCEQQAARGFKQLLGWLPTHHDEQESCCINAALVDQIASNNRFLLGENNSNLPKIKSVLESFVGNEDLAEEATREKAKAILQMFNQ